jgi:predicted RNA-binding protein with PIN domain
LGVSIARILVDGYSLLHGWPELAPGKPRYSEAARDQLIFQLTQYRDLTGIPITIFFDGNRPLANLKQFPSTPELEILYSRAGQTADDMIERTAHRLRPYGEVLVVTDDFAERDTVQALGALVSSCANFIATLQDALGEMQADLKRRNREVAKHFRRR